MYFKKLEICGFKSFAEKTLLHFEPGITAVVGPNGCGKSNIFDSIRWCLGEQSIKSLRGAKMEDVIFNGTETAPAQNVAEVSLTISNEAKILPIDYEEITITRRLFRSGESEYLLNNNLVRLRDINDLLMGTGIGAESYSLVEQGKIDLVISSRAEDRRLVFDEATGVSRYKAKKKEAMRRLEETDNNLLRVNDIVTEVKRQIASIERQANKARRYKEVFDKLKNSELKYATLELVVAKSELAMLAEISKKTSQEETELGNKLQELDGKLISKEKELQDLDSRLSELRDEIIYLENSNLQSKNHIALNQERRLDLEKHAGLLVLQKEQLRQKIAGHEKNMEELTEQLLCIHRLRAQQEAAVEEKSKNLELVESSIKKAHQEITAAKNNIFEIHHAETRINNSLSENTAQGSAFSSRLRRLEAEKIKTESENAELLKNLEAVTSEIAAQKIKIGQTAGRLENIKNSKRNLEDTVSLLKEKIRNLENEDAGLKSQLSFLKELKLTYDRMPQAKDGIVEISEIPQGESVTGIIAHAREVAFDDAAKTYRIRCECKFISFDLEALENKIEKIAQDTFALKEETVMKEQEAAELLMQLDAVDGELQQEKFHLTNKEASSSNISSNAKKIQEELSLISLEIAEVEENLRDSKEKNERLMKEQVALRGELLQSEQLMTANQDIVSENTKTREDLLVEVTQTKAELQSQRSQENTLQANLAFFRNTLVQDTSTLSVNDKEITDSLKKADALNEESGALEDRIKTNAEDIEKKNGEHSRISQQKIEELNSLDFIQKSILDTEEKADRAKEEHHRNQMQEQELTFKLAGIKERILQAYSVDLEEMPPAGNAAEDFNIETLAQDISNLKEKAASFGTVNLVAIEELDELKKRHDFLTQQHNDLLAAKDSLQKAILKINRTTRKMFLETFQIVAEEFKNYFKLLFGGGEAKIFLIDEEDVLESGIEIICRPPGKKLQNITLLSGGEKALSAIALIFAIFKTKPSPFCVLDEIDAALDESNIDRFSRMLSEFAKTSQFIVITHNKKTIARAHVMYGITMEKSGMSKIVSVKLHESHNRTQIPPPPEDESAHNDSAPADEGARDTTTQQV